jgi:hypothetical protein
VVEMPDVDISDYEFEDVIQTFISKMGFTVESVERMRDGSIDFVSKTKNPMGGRVISVVRASPSPRPITREDVEDLCESMFNHQAVRAAYITVSSFTEEAEEYSKDKPISLISKYQLLESIEKRGLASDKKFMEALDKFGLGEKHFQDVEQAFISSRNEGEARKHFESRSVRRGLFGAGKSSEIPIKVTLRYAPVSVFKVVTKKYHPAESRELRVEEKRDFMFVNLNNLDLYYIKQRRRKNSVELSLNRSEIISKIMNLPEYPKSHLMDLLEHGDLPLEDLEGKDLSILKNKKIINIYEGRKGASGMTAYAEQFLEGMLETLNMLIDEITTGISAMGEESGRTVEEKPLPKKVEAQINMPHHEGGLYDIWKHLESREGLRTESDVDIIAFSSKDVGELLGKIMKGDVSREGIIFMPYYRAKYVDANTKKFSRYEILVTPKFKGLEKPSKEVSVIEKEVRKIKKKTVVSRRGVAGEFKLIK